MYPERSNGAMMSITAKPGVTDAGEPSVIVTWTIDYDGPRHPFAIQKPDLTIPTSGQTRLYAYYDKPDGTCAATFLDAATPFEITMLSEQHYAVSVDRKPVTGWFEVPVTADVRPEHIYTPLLTPTILGRPAYIQLEHNPKWRGAECKPPLDAWTGHLVSNVVKVELSE